MVKVEYLTKKVIIFSFMLSIVILVARIQNLFVSKLFCEYWFSYLIANIVHNMIFQFTGPMLCPHCDIAYKFLNIYTCIYIYNNHNNCNQRLWQTAQQQQHCRRHLPANIINSSNKVWNRLQMLLSNFERREDASRFA